MRRSIKKTYIWYHDKKIIGLFIISIAISFQIFAFLKIHLLSSIHGYTVGMLLGFYNPFFYIFITYLGLQIISEGKLKLPQWSKLNLFNYWIIVLSIIFVSVTSSYYQGDSDYKVIGKQTWDSFDKWYQDFTSEKNAWFPTNTNGGVIGVFMYSFFGMIISEIGALILSIVIIIINIFYFVIIPLMNFYKWWNSASGKNTREMMLHNRQKMTIKKNNEKRFETPINVKRWDSEDQTNWKRFENKNNGNKWDSKNNFKNQKKDKNTFPFNN